MEGSGVRELKRLREENARLKRLEADLSLDKVMLQDVAERNGKRISTPLGGALSAAALLDCEVTGTHRSTYRYRLVRPPQTALRGRIPDLAHSRIR